MKNSEKTSNSTAIRAVSEPALPAGAAGGSRDMPPPFYRPNSIQKFRRFGSAGSTTPTTKSRDDEVTRSAPGRPRGGFVPKRVRKKINCENDVFSCGAPSD